jgi:hypothetical protein
LERANLDNVGKSSDKLAGSEGKAGAKEAWKETAAKRSKETSKATSKETTSKESLESTQNLLSRKPSKSLQPGLRSDVQADIRRNQTDNRDAQGSAAIAGPPVAPPSTFAGHVADGLSSQKHYQHLAIIMEYFKSRNTLAKALPTSSNHNGVVENSRDTRHSKY